MLTCAILVARSEDLIKAKQGPLALNRIYADACKELGEKSLNNLQKLSVLTRALVGQTQAMNTPATSHQHAQNATPLAAPVTLEEVRAAIKVETDLNKKAELCRQARKLRGHGELFATGASGAVPPPAATMTLEEVRAAIKVETDHAKRAELCRLARNLRGDGDLLSPSRS